MRSFQKCHFHFFFVFGPHVGPMKAVWPCSGLAEPQPGPHPHSCRTLSALHLWGSSTEIAVLVQHPACGTHNAPRLYSRFASRIRCTIPLWGVGVEKGVHRTPLPSWSNPPTQQASEWQLTPSCLKLVPSLSLAAAVQCSEPLQ